MRTAFLIDGGFFLTRFRHLQGSRTPAEAAEALHRMCREHLVARERSANAKPRRLSHLYRIFYYDCPPLSKKAHNPLTKQAIDFSRTQLAAWRLQFFEELKRLRKVALRLGYLNERSGQWVLRPGVLKELLVGTRRVDQLSERDVKYDVRQKGVDMRLGLDIASLAYKKQVDQIVLVAGDSDFVPAAKLARREGIDFILDPMWAPILDDLHEHIDGLRSMLPRRRAPVGLPPGPAPGTDPDGGATGLPDAPR
jgi:uncharacterized LabA/DUF88 family protein